MPQPSLPRPAERAAGSSAASSTAGAPSQPPAAGEDREDPPHMLGSHQEAADADAEAGSSA